MAIGNKGHGRARNVFDVTTGLPIMINLFIIKHLYYHMKKADCFIEESSGKKPRSVEIYGNVIPISRQRFDRINKGERFELTSREADAICSTFGIDIKYFRRDDPVAIDIPDVNLTDWKCFYKVEHNCLYHFSSELKDRDIKNRCNKVKEALKHIAGIDWGEYKDNQNPLYMVWYYFRYGVRYEAESNIDKYIKALQEIKCTDWNDRDMEELEDCCQLIKKQYDYINSLLTIYNLKDE